MRIEAIYFSPHFKRSLKKLPHKLRNLALEREQIFRENCFDPRLRTHKLSGNLSEQWSFSITHAHRIVFTFLSYAEVVFDDIGDHDVYR